jgi:hypothetical protein
MTLESDEEKRHAQGLRPRQLHQRAQGAVDAAEIGLEYERED